MGVLPLQFPAGQNADSLGLTGEETFSITGFADVLNAGDLPKTAKVSAAKADGTTIEFDAVVRIDTPKEADYFRHGGILLYVLRQIAAQG
jgi:aconitate hydratase